MKEHTVYEPENILECQSIPCKECINFPDMVGNGLGLCITQEEFKKVV